MRSCTLLFLTLAALASVACDPGPTPGGACAANSDCDAGKVCSDGFCVDGAEGEGEGEGGEGEGEAPPDISYQWEDAAGDAIANDLLTINHDSTLGALDVALGLRNTGDADFTILSDPPLLVSGDGYEVTAQPPAVVPANASVPFTLRFDPLGGGLHEGLVLFAYGVFPEQRVRLNIEGNAGGPVPGLAYAIYDGDFDLLPDFSTLTPAETGTIADFDISARVDTDFFAYTFDGFIQVDVDGDFTFFTTSDDGSRLLIAGNVVVDNDGLHGPVEAAGQVSLPAGLHAIRVEFFEKGGGATLVVEWQGTGVNREVIPASRLFLP